MLKACGIKPSTVCVLDQSVNDCVMRLAKRRVNSVTGQKFNLGLSAVPAENLCKLDWDNEKIVTKRYLAWEDVGQFIEEEFKSTLQSISADRGVVQVQNQITDAVLFV